MSRLSPPLPGLEQRLERRRGLHGFEERPQAMSERVELVARQRIERSEHASERRLGRATRDRPPLARQANQYTARIVGRALALDESLALEPLHEERHRALLCERARRQRVDRETVRLLILREKSQDEYLGVRDSGALLHGARRFTECGNQTADAVQSARAFVPLRRDSEVIVTSATTAAGSLRHQWVRDTAGIVSLPQTY